VEKSRREAAAVARRVRKAGGGGASSGARKLKSVDLSPVPCGTGTPTRSVTQIEEGPEERSTMRSVGLDLGASSISYCERQNGAVTEQRTARSLEELLRGVLGPKTTRAQVAIEACREAWHVHDVLTAAGHEVVLVDTTRVRQMGLGHHGRKTNRIDAEVLATALEEKRIPKAHLLSPERRKLRERVLMRASLVETRSRMVVTIRGLLRARGLRIGGCSAGLFVMHLRKRVTDADLLSYLEPLCAVLEAVETKIVEVEQDLKKLAEGEALVAPLMSIPGVSLIVSLMFLSVVDDAKRFRNAHQFESYLGLVPGEFSTGEARKLGSITKAGNGYLRAILVQAAWAIFTHADLNDPLHRWGLAVAERRGKMVAAIALARRLAGIMWAMARDGTFYDPKSIDHAHRQRDPEVQKEIAARAQSKRAEKLRRYGRSIAARPNAATEVHP
jgi:transposase